MGKILKKIRNWIITVAVLATMLGYILRMVLENYEVTKTAFSNKDYALLFKPELFLELTTYGYGILVIAFFIVMYFVFSNDSSKKSKRMLKSKAEGIEGALENSRFLTDKERDDLFKPYKYSKLSEVKKDGVPVRAVVSGRDMEINISSPMHGLIIGATGSGKTTTFINPMIQILGESSAGSSMIMTDPKGELFQLHSKKLKEKGYKVMVLDLREPYSSYRWNPLGEIYDRYQEYISYGKGIFSRGDSPADSGLELTAPAEAFEPFWFEYEGKGYPNKKALLTVVKTKRQKIYDGIYEDLNDLVSVLCPIESKDDPVWEKGARSIIMATLLAMLEDSEDPELGMTKEKFNFFNLNKAISNSENDFLALKRYFQGRNKLSKAVTLSRQVLSAADNTLSSYMSIAFDKMNMFNDEGICALTSATDIDPDEFADRPTALFLKIPDEKDTRHGLAAVFILSIYKALIKKASAREDLSLPRNVYFILDEFGNMPKIEKFDKMITVGRSRKIWFNMVVQSYAQLNNVYGDTVADIVKSNCGIKMFIGSNDIGTCKEFSELCGNMTVTTNSVSSSTGDKSGQINYSSQIQTRPLIYPSELQKLNNSKDMGNAIIVTFGNYPLKTKFTPSFKCPMYKMGMMELDEIKSNAFFADDIYYDLDARNDVIFRRQESSEAASDEEE